jgi:alpha-acetolactate decarboxylase
MSLCVMCRNRLIGGLALLTLVVGSPSQSQQMQPTGNSPMHTVHEPYAIETFGVLRNMMLSGDFSAKVRLGAVLAKHPTIGVGAVADARGEITILDGNLIVSYGKTGVSADANSEEAALLATGSATEWQSLRVERNIAPEEVESYIAAAAKANGLDPEKSFPFEVRGPIGPYFMHVNAEPTSGPHGMGLPMAITVQSQGDLLDGTIAGLYVSPDLVGIATHGGERTHAHWVALDKSSTAHLDRWGLKEGAFLLLPKR